MITVGEEIRSPIRRVLWGSLIVAVDFNVSGFDVLVDVVGAALIAWAIVDLYRLFPAPSVPARLMVVAAGITVLGGVSDLVGSTGVELVEGEFSVWAATVATAQVLGSYALAIVLAHNLAGIPRVGVAWSGAANALKWWAVPFILLIDLLAVLGLASGVFLLFAIPVLYGLVRHLTALVQTVVGPF